MNLRIKNKEEIIILKLDFATKYKDSEMYTDEMLVDYINTSQDKDAQDEIYKRYQKIVAFKSKKYWTNAGDDNDMEQEGFIGLINAIRDYNPDKKIPFKAFAELCINRQMITALKSSRRQKHAPLNQYVSLDKPFSDDDNSDKILLNIIKDEDSVDPEDMLVSQETSKIIITRLGETLSELEQQVLKGLLEDKRYVEIARDIDKHIKSVDNAVQRIRRKLEGIINELREEGLI